MKFVRFFFVVFLEILPKFIDFVNSNDCIGKNHVKIYQTTISFYSKKYLKSMKNRLSLVKKMRNSGNFVFTIMLTRSSERILNPMRYTGRYLSTRS